MNRTDIKKAQNTPGLTGSLEDYLETIMLLMQEQPVARVRDIAESRQVKAGSVTPALKRLEEMGLVKYHKREYVTLTREGQQQARRVFSRHELLTRFFKEVLQMPAKASDIEACVMEHNLSDEAMDRLARFFEFLNVAPENKAQFLEKFHSYIKEKKHSGQAGKKTSAEDKDIISVADLKTGESGKVVQVNAVGAIRQRLLDMGIIPSAVVKLARRAPAGGPLWIDLHGSQIALRKSEAKMVLLRTV